MAGVLRMHVLAAEYGDCLWIEYGDPEAPHRILVDGGTPGTFTRLKPALERVCGAQPSFELFVITHIDDDHIGGSLKVLSYPILATQFKNVWFNGYDHLVEAWPGENFGPVQGERLTEAILARGLPWNAQFGGHAVMRNTDDKPVTVTLDGGAKVTVLTPSVLQLKKLLPVWKKAVTDAGLVPGHRKELVRDAEGEEALSGLNIDKLANAITTEDSAEANGSSIATLVEFDGKRLLLGADAHPGELLSGIQAFTGGKRLKVDVFKLPHHGSKGNTTLKLLDAVEADVVVFSTNGKRFRHPDPEAVARCIKRFGNDVRLAFNYESEFTTIWRSEHLQQQWKYKVEYGAGDSGLSLTVS